MKHVLPGKRQKQLRVRKQSKSNRPMTKPLKLPTKPMHVSNGHKPNGCTTMPWQLSPAIGMPSRVRNARSAPLITLQMRISPNATKVHRKLTSSVNVQPWNATLNGRRNAKTKLPKLLRHNYWPINKRNAIEKKQNVENKLNGIAGAPRKLAQQMNNSDKDEVEAYYKAALESEAEARKQEVEEKKAAQAQLLRDAQRSAAERVDRDLQAQKDIERQGRAINEAGAAQQAERRREEEQRKAAYEANAA